MNKRLQVTRTEIWDTVLSREELEALLRSHFNMNKCYQVHTTVLTGSRGDDITGLLVHFSMVLSKRDEPDGPLADQPKAA